MVKVAKSFKYAAGKRRAAVARIRLFDGKGENVVNGKPFEKYFQNALFTQLALRPFAVTNLVDKYYVSVRVVGGGLKGQVDAVAHGIAKALSKKSAEKFHASLKKAGFLTRDSRIRQRRMVGMGGKSRRKKQSPKR